MKTNNKNISKAQNLPNASCDTKKRSSQIEGRFFVGETLNEGLDLSCCATTMVGIRLRKGKDGEDWRFLMGIGRGYQKSSELQEQPHPKKLREVLTDTCKLCVYWGMPQPCSSGKTITTSLVGILYKPSWFPGTVFWQDPIYVYSI